VYFNVSRVYLIFTDCKKSLGKFSRHFFEKKNSAKISEGNNGSGIVGIGAYTGTNTTKQADGTTRLSSRVKLMPVKFLDWNGAGTASDAIIGLNYAIKMGAHVSNHSWGSDWVSYSQQKLFEEILDDALVFY
jgi:hypothetical protein